MEKEINIEERSKELVEEAMSLYNTIEIDSGSENNYTDANSKIKEVLNGEDPLYLESDLAEHLSLLTMIGYNAVGVRYLEQLYNNKSITLTVISDLINRVNRLTSLLMCDSNDVEENKIEEKELKGISKD